jgi:hypothetical protein
MLLSSQIEAGGYGITKEEIDFTEPVKGVRAGLYHPISLKNYQYWY